jgi:hypothetical protein
MLFCRCVLSLSQRESFLRSASLGHGAVLDRRVFSLPQNAFYSLFRSNSVTEFKTQICNKV